MTEQQAKEEKIKAIADIIINAHFPKTFKQKIREAQRQRLIKEKEAKRKMAIQEERKEFWKAAYLEILNCPANLNFPPSHYADKALENFDERFNNTNNQNNEG